MQTDAQSVEGAEYKRQFGAGVTVLDIDHPLTADANALGQRRLIEFETLTPVSNDGAEVCGCSYEHDASKMLPFAYISI
jgi:hypothetical protein